MSSKFMRGGPLLSGNNTVPGQFLTENEKTLYLEVLKACTDYGLDYYPTIIQKLSWAEMSQVAAYGGFPIRYPHWRFGMEYEELQRSFEYGLSRIFELVINAIPSIVYVLNSNTIVDNVTVVAHATGHNHFFKNNIYFSATDTDMVTRMAHHASRIKRYMDRWGMERVTEFIDRVLSIQTLIDPSEAWDVREMSDFTIRDTREYEFPRRLPVDPERPYMDSWLNSEKWLDKERKRIEKNEQAKDLDLFRTPTKNIMRFLRDNARLKPWQTDILAMLYDESMYFAPQRATKVGNEGCACVSPDTLICTSDGILTAEELVNNKVSTKIFDGDKSQDVTNWFKFENKRVFKIRTRRGYRLIGSDTHRIQDSEGKWHKLSEVKKGLNIRITASDIWNKDYQKVEWKVEPKISAREFCESRGVSYSSVRYKDKVLSAVDDFSAYLTKFDTLAQHVRRKQIKVPELMSEDFASFLGYMTGNGHISKKLRSLGLTSGDREQCDEYMRLVEGLFRLDSKIKWDDSSLNGRWRVHVCSKNLEDLLVSFGFVRGVSARIKKIPSIVLKSPKSVMSAYLRSYFDCDGSANENGVILSTFSIRLARQTQTVLLNYGIISSIYKKEKGNWHLSILGLSAKKFYYEIGFGLTRKQEILKQFVEGHRWWQKQRWVDDIVSIKEVESGPVFDITVADSHKYASQGFVNHNSKIDYEIMVKKGYAGLGQEKYDDGIIEYAIHKTLVLGGKYSMNPYKLGFTLLTDIEDRWNRGRFGDEYENCKHIEQKEKWDLNLGIGKKKMFEVVKHYNDVNLIREFFTQEFCQKYEFFEWKKWPNGEIKIENKGDTPEGFKRIKDKLLARYINGGLPDIRLTDPNHRNKGIMLLQHEWDGRTLLEHYVKETLPAIYSLWGNDIILASRKNNREEIVYVCKGPESKNVKIMDRTEYESASL